MGKTGKNIKLPSGFTILNFNGGFVPALSGVYVWLLKEDSSFPQPKDMVSPIFNTLEIDRVRYRVLYTGKASNLHTRLRTHLLGGRIAKSTLRRSMAALFGFKFEQYVSGKTLKVRISAEEENYISQWLYNNCIVLYKECLNYETEERTLIQLLDPPLNIDDNPNIHNGIYIRQLSKLRSSKYIVANSEVCNKHRSFFDILFQGKVFEGTIFEEEKFVLWGCLFVFAFMAWAFISYYKTA